MSCLNNDKGNVEFSKILLLFELQPNNKNCYFKSKCCAIVKTGTSISYVKNVYKLYLVPTILEWIF